MYSHPLPLFVQFPSLRSSVPWVQLIRRPTQLGPLRSVGAAWNHPALYVKREDLTGVSYGGNKVRNLEFILGDALKKRAHTLITVAPLGSNFIGALAAHAQAVQLDVEVAHFVVSRNPQIDAHSRFSADMGAQMTLFQGKRGAIPAALTIAARWLHTRLRDDAAYWVAPGGSSVRGALGHTNGILEMFAQVNNGHAPAPDVIVVGAGTCGTMAGMLAALKATGSKTQLIGVRCVDRLICNRLAIARLGNRVLHRLGSQERLSVADIVLVDAPQDAGYSLPSAAAEDVTKLFAGAEGITLDTTYTAKVALWLQQAVASGALNGKRVLYWHTFSPAAMHWRGTGALYKSPLGAAESCRSAPAGILLHRGTRSA